MYVYFPVDHCIQTWQQLQVPCDCVTCTCFVEYTSMAFMNTTAV